MRRLRGREDRKAKSQEEKAVPVLVRTFRDLQKLCSRLFRSLAVTLSLLPGGDVVFELARRLCFLSKPSGGTGCDFHGRALVVD